MRFVPASRLTGARFFTVSLLAVLAGFLFFSFPSQPSANCINSLGATGGEATQLMYFPNWTKAYAASFDVTDWEVDCGLAGCAVCHPAAGDSCGGAATLLQVANLTIANFGTATTADITNVYWCSGPIATPTWHTMVPVAPKMWTWAWNGVEANPSLQIAGPLWTTIRVYVDIGPTPTDGATVKMGIPYDPILGYQGGLADRCCCNMGWSDTPNPVPKTIKYVAKFVDKISAAPGDTLNYTIYYGRPGVANLQNLTIIDTQPPYTHWNGVANPMPDPGWDPNWSPPPKLRWTLFPAAVPVTGGPTGMITFQMTIDWGNGESFEPGSGDVAAPENMSLWNNATGVFPNLAPGTQAHLSNNARTTVMRFLFWKLGDRDVIYSNSPSAIDEITYSIFIKNMSATKTWWGVSIWDTVPIQLDPWALDCGVEDPCVGWTMTPSGCVAGGGGKVISAGKTIITWKLDMPPYMTLNLRWKAKVGAGALAGQTCLNKVSVMEYGENNIVDGTGHSTTPRNFTHVAPVVLRTTYVSYVAFHSESCFDAGNNWYFIVMYPLHPSSAFQLFRLTESLVCVSGPRASIVTPAPAWPCNSWPGPGCNVGIERQPQYYGPSPDCVEPIHHYYKLVSNAPILWELSPDMDEINQDSNMYSTFTTMSFRGYTCYTYRRQTFSLPSSDNGDYLGIANTENMPTTIHMFKWNQGILDWDYIQSRTIDPYSQFMPGGTASADEGHYRIISSDSQLIIWKGYVLGTDFDNWVTMAPATNGNLVASQAGDEFWVYCGPRGGTQVHAAMSVQNIGPTNATFNLSVYQSDEMFDTVDLVPTNLGGSSGSWSPVNSGTIPAGQNQTATPYNPYVYGAVNPCYDQNTSFQDNWGLYRVTLASNNTPIQVRPGRGRPEKYGGYVFHGLNWAGQPDKVVQQFWQFIPPTGGAFGSTLLWFCPSPMVTRITNEEGLSATYTTTGPDQPVVQCDIQSLNAGCGVNFKVEVLSPVNTVMIAQANGSYFTERHFAAPFLSTGTHYDIQAPAVVFVGQSFWITVVVLMQGGGTKTDYIGTTSFSSTDPKAQIQGVAMDTYNYSGWNGCGTTCGVKMFINVSFNALGLINLTGQDTLDGSITGMTTIMVVGADVKLEKRKKLSVAASGDTVQFWICWSNYSSATAYSFTITDAVPNGTTYVPELASLAICGQKGPVDASASLAASTSTTTTPPTNFATVNAGSTAASTTRWLRWTIRDAYVNSTGCVCFKVVVN